jgi:hypothetical protein
MIGQINPSVKKFKKYEDMTPEEIAERNEDASNWKEGDIEILTPGGPDGDEPRFEELLPKNSLRHVKHN